MKKIKIKTEGEHLAPSHSHGDCDQVLFGRACDVGRGRGGKGKGSESFSHRDASKSYLESVSCEGGIYEGRGRDLGATRGLYE